MNISRSYYIILHSIVLPHIHVKYYNNKTLPRNVGTTKPNLTCRIDGDLLWHPPPKGDHP